MSDMEDPRVRAVAWTLGRTTRSGVDYDGPFNVEDYMEQARRVLEAADAVQDRPRCPRCGADSASYPAEVYCVECATTDWPESGGGAVQDRSDERMREALRTIFAEAHLHDGDNGVWACDLAAEALNYELPRSAGVVEAQDQHRPCKTCADRGGPDALTPCPTCNRYGPVVEGDEDRQIGSWHGASVRSVAGEEHVSLADYSREWHATEAQARRAEAAETRVGELTRERDDAQELASEQITRAEVAEDRCRELEAALREADYAISRWENDAPLDRDHLDECDAHYLEYVALQVRAALSAAGEAGDRP